MSRVKLRGHGANNVIRKLTIISSRASDVAPAWPEVAEMIAVEVTKQFESKGAYMGTPWVPLQPATIAQKRREGSGGSMLVQTGRLRRLMTGKRLPVLRISGNEMSVGTVDRIARFQHSGTHRNGKRAIPPRTLIKVTGHIKSNAANILGRYVMKGKI